MMRSLCRWLLAAGLTTVVVVGALVGVGGVSSRPADADVGAPAWWSGDCDAPNWNARAAAAGWTGAGAHRLGASYFGVPVCGPRPGADGAPDVMWLRQGWGHLEWECTELAFRSMHQVYGVTPYGANGSTVVRNYTPAAGGDLEVVQNGTAGRPPTPGDVVSFDSTSGGVGHVGVIASASMNASGNGTVRMMAQNDTADGWRTLTVTGWVIQPVGSLVPYGWLHRRGVPPPGRTLVDSSGIGASPGAVARRPDGRLEQWGLNTRIAGGSDVFRRWQVTPGGEWSAWEPVEGYLTSIAVATNADGRLEVWGANAKIAGGDNVFRRSETSPGGEWSSWEAVDGYLTGISMAAQSDGRLEVTGVNTFIPDSQSNIFGRGQMTPGGHRTGWAPEPGYLTAVETVAAGDGHLETWGVNALVPDGQSNIFGRAQVVPGGEWSGWGGVPGYLTSVTLASNADGRLEAIGANTNLAGWNIFTRAESSPAGPWSGWTGVVGYLTS